MEMEESEGHISIQIASVSLSPGQLSLCSSFQIFGLFVCFFFLDLFPLRTNPFHVVPGSLHSSS